METLAKDIAQHRLLWGLNVWRVLGGSGVETGTFDIPAVDRRFQALLLLVKQKQFAKIPSIPCIAQDAA